MNRRLSLLGALLVSCAFPAQCFAQSTNAPPEDTRPAMQGARVLSPTAAPPTAAPSTTAPTVKIALYTPVEFEILATLNSKASRSGQTFPIRLTRPITVGDQIIVPAGAPGMGEVIQAAKSGMAGTAGELVITVRYVEYAGVRIPLRRCQLGGIGVDRSKEASSIAVAASASVPVVGIAALFISGGEKTIPTGTRGNALVAADTELPVPEVVSVAPSPAPGPAAVPVNPVSN